MEVNVLLVLQENDIWRYKRKRCYIFVIISFFFLFVFAADREVQRILLELLNQMDGFDQNVNVKVQ